MPGFGDAIFSWKISRWKLLLERCVVRQLGGEGRGGRINSYIGSSLDDSNLVFEIPVYGLFIFAPVVGRVAS